MDKSELLTSIRTARTAWEGLLAAIDHSRYEEPGISGEWTIKDIIAHITWFEDEILRMLITRSFAGASMWWILPADERNAQIYAANVNRSLPDVLAESQNVHSALVAAIESVSDEELNDTAGFIESPPGALPWEIIAQNTYEHYQHHTRDLQKWLKQSG